MPVSTKHLEFCRAYAGNGGNGRQAAIEAGYAARHAAITACRLRKRPHIREYIDILLHEGTLTGAPPAAPMIRPWRSPVPGGVNEDAKPALDRTWAISRLKEIIDIAVGEKLVTVILPQKVRTDNGDLTVVATRMELTARDPAAAIRAIDLYLRECHRAEEAQKTTRVSRPGPDQSRPSRDAVDEIMAGMLAARRKAAASSAPSRPAAR